MHGQAFSHRACRSGIALYCFAKGESSVEPRLNPFQFSPKGYQAMSNLQQFVDSCGLERLLLELVKMRASQINGCAYCLDMHSKDARALGETEQRLYLLNAWRESAQYTERERAALEWTEAVTLVADSGVEDEVYERVKRAFHTRGTRQSHPCYRRDQRLEPAEHRVSGRAWHLPVVIAAPQGRSLSASRWPESTSSPVLLRFAASRVNPYNRPVGQLRAALGSRAPRAAARIP